MFAYKQFICGKKHVFLGGLKRIIYIVMCLLEMNTFAQSPQYSYHLVVLERKQNTPLANVGVRVKDSLNNEIGYAHTDSSGRVVFMLNNTQSYRVESESKLLSSDIALVSNSKRIPLLSMKTSIVIDTIVLFKVQKSDDCGSIESIHFQFKSSKISDEECNGLNKLIKFKKDHVNLQLQLSGHEDCKEAKSLINYSKKRVEAVRQYLLQNGFKEEDLETVASRARRLVNACDCKTKAKCTEEQYAESRRVEFRIIRFK